MDHHQDDAAAVTEEGSSTFASWVSPHLAAMKQVALARGAAASAEDVVQEALVRAWQRRSTYRSDRGSVRSWLLAITIDQNSRRAARAKPGTEQIDLIEDNGQTLDWAADLDLRKAIHELPRRQREAVTWHYYIGLSVVETAELMGGSSGTVKSTLSDARRNLAKKLGMD